MGESARERNRQNLHVPRCARCRASPRPDRARRDRACGRPRRGRRSGFHIRPKAAAPAASPRRQTEAQRNSAIALLFWAPRWRTQGRVPAPRRNCACVYSCRGAKGSSDNRRFNMTATRSEYLCAANRKGWRDEPALKDTGFPKRIEFPHRDGAEFWPHAGLRARSEFRANRAILAAPTPPGCVAGPSKTAPAVMQRVYLSSQPCRLSALPKPARGLRMLTITNLTRRYGAKAGR